MQGVKVNKFRSAYYMDLYIYTKLKFRDPK